MRGSPASIVARVPGTGRVDYVCSFVDGGWYAEEFAETFNGRRLAGLRSRVSRRLYDTKEQLIAALTRGTHKWGAWK